jgi:sucrose-phosphate synthase
MFSPHGLIRYNNPEIGRDKDTGGQVKYVLELLEAVSLHKEVRKVDLFTRRIRDNRVSATYGEPIEQVNSKARIVRINCGGNTYRRKEVLWDYLDEFADKTIRFIEQEDDFPDVVHGHYADGNYIAGELSKVFGIPFIATAHSLGKNKKKILLSQGMSAEKINSVFKIEQRIEVEESAIKHADIIIASTDHEIKTQYPDYDNINNARFEVIPPGINTNVFYPYYRQNMPSFQMTVEQEQAFHRINSDIRRFLFNPDKPLIVSIGRADKRKNFETIIQAFGEDKELQSIANLAIFAGVRKEISKMPEDEQETLINLLLLLDKYDLYGKMAIPKKNDPQLEVPEIYRIASHLKGVFVNATPGENFGLTIVEAAATGLPVIASPTGGPKEIIGFCKNGLLIDVEDPSAIAAAAKKIITDVELWKSFSEKGVIGVTKKYSWSAHSDKYISVIKNLVRQKKQKSTIISDGLSYGKKLAKAERFLIFDLDGTMINGNDTTGLKELNSWITKNNERIAFGIASGRNKQLLAKALKDYELPVPDILICSAGSEIYYTENFFADSGWESHISYQWKREEIQKVLNRFPRIRLQENEAQRKFKLSYYVENDFNGDDLAYIYKLLDEHKLRFKVLLTDNHFLDFLPFRASKGNAVRYLSYKWKSPLENFITAGNGGNDIDMLKGKTRGIVVANYSPELENLKNSRNIYFAEYPLSKGIMDGIRHYEEQLFE